jgi:putative protease
MSTLQKKQLPELLAPAGGFEQLRYALYFGADAVYLACDKFGLRQRAQNFSLEEMPQAVEMAHSAGAKVYVTCNAYLHDSDFTDLPFYLEQLEAAGVDAVIVSDLGVLAMVRKHAPSLDIHVSTQASVSNVEAARMWHELGANRIVTAREMSLEEIAQLKRELPEVELEVFVQGAMCMAISGRCLISDFLTGRSANQGHCVQPCRWSYRLEEQTRPGEYFPVEEDENGTYLMNSKDLNMLAHVDDLISAGVDSIKIEGRVKKAFYVATVVNAYRHVLDGESPEVWAEELNCISHRPYSTGFFYGDAQQSFQDDIYVQLYDWVAEVVESEQLESGLWRSIVYCRNRFYKGNVLELVSPHAAVQPLEILNLEEVFFAAAGGPDLSNEAGLQDEAEQTLEVGSSTTFATAGPSMQERSLGVEVNALPVEVANKAMGTYAVTTTKKLERYDILRAKRIDPSRKN